MPKLKAALLAAIGCGVAVACSAAPPPASTVFKAPWNAGVAADEPAFQAQAIDRDTLAIRQSLRTSAEAPFLYLLFGSDRALLIDSGAGGADVRAEVDRHVAAWLAAKGRASIPLVVMHTHGHGDHIAGDAAFAARPETQVVGTTPEAVAAFFGLKAWPEQPAAFDLGGRVVDILPTPGHHASHIMVFDRTTRILFTGDAVYPGHLTFRCDQAATTLASATRAAAFAKAHRARWLLGAHVEMTAQPRKAFEAGSKSRPNEHLLELRPQVLDQVRDALTPLVAKPRVETHDEFVLFPYPADPRGKAPPDWCQTP